MPADILVIDDNIQDLTLMRRILERAGYAVRQAESGEEGIRLAQSSAPDCMLVDGRMPGVDGYEFCRRIRADERFRNVPILMLTGADSSSAVIDGLEAGADDFVTKASDLQVILARVRALLRVKAYQDRIVEQSAELRRAYEEIREKSDKILALNQRMNKDLQFARRVQEGLLPVREYETAAVQIRSAYLPSETLSGDFYDYYEVGDSVILFTADVSGHGLPSAILVSLLKSFLHSELDEKVPLEIFLERLNGFLHETSLPSQFATALVFRLRRNQLEYASAGHPPFIHVSGETGRSTMYELPGHLLGASPDSKFESATREVASGDVLFSCTDGLTDRRTAQGEFYPLERVAGILERHASSDVDSIFARVREDALAFEATDEFRDDIAVIVARVR